MTTLPIEIDDATASAFRAAAPSTQERITGFVADYLRVALLPETDRARAYHEAADALGASAGSNGWNDDLTDALLRGDFDVGE